MKQATVTSASPTNYQMKGTHQNLLRCFRPTGSPLKKGRTSPFSRSQLTFKKVVHASFRPSKIYTKNKKTHSRNEGTPSFRRRHNTFELFKQTNSWVDSASAKRSVEVELWSALTPSRRRQITDKVTIIIKSKGFNDICKYH